MACGFVLRFRSRCLLQCLALCNALMVDAYDIRSTLTDLVDRLHTTMCPNSAALSEIIDAGFTQDQGRDAISKWGAEDALTKLKASTNLTTPNTTDTSNYTQVHNFVKGEQVKILRAHQWLDGTIEETFQTDSVIEGHSIKAGTLLVNFSGRSDYIVPDEVDTVVRKVLIKKLDCVKIIKKCGNFSLEKNVIVVESETPGLRQNGSYTLVNTTGVHVQKMGHYIDKIQHSGIMAFICDEIVWPPKPQEFEQCKKDTFAIIEKSKCPGNKVPIEGVHSCWFVRACFGMLLLLAGMILLFGNSDRRVEHGMFWVALVSLQAASFCMSIFATFKVFECYPNVQWLSGFIYTWILTQIFFDVPLKCITKCCLNNLCHEKEGCGYLIFIGVCCLIGGQLGTVIVLDSYTPSDIVLLGRHPLSLGLFYWFLRGPVKYLISVIRDCVSGMLSLFGCSLLLKIGGNVGCLHKPSRPLENEKPDDCKGWARICTNFVFAAPPEGNTEISCHGCYGCICQRIRFGMAEPLPKFKKPDRWTEPAREKSDKSATASGYCPLSAVETPASETVSSQSVSGA